MSNLGDLLKLAIRDSGKPLAEIERSTGVARDSIARFVYDEHTLRLDSAEKLAGYFCISATGEATSKPRRRVLRRRPDTGASDILGQIASALDSKRSALKIPKPKGHFFTVVEIEPSVKLEVLRRARGNSTVIAIGLAFNSGSASLNHRRADRFLSYLKRKCPPSAIEEFPARKTNCYLTCVKAIHGGSQSDDDIVEWAVSVASWFLQHDYALVGQI